MIGNKIRELRKNNNLSISELASKVGISDSYISQLERNVVDPSVSVLQKIATALCVPIASFFEETYEVPILIRHDEYKPHPTSANGFILNQMSPAFAEYDTHMEINHFKLSAKNEPFEYKHSGETCIHLLKGSVEITISHHVHLLNKGDSIYIASDVPYLIHNPGSSAALGLICSTRTFT